MIETVAFAIADGALGKQRGEAAPARIEQAFLVTYIQETLVLAGKAGAGQVLRSGGAAYREAQLGTVLFAELHIGVSDLALQIVRQARLVHNLAQFSGDVPQLRVLCVRDIPDQFAHWFPGGGAVEHGAVGGGSNGKAVGNANPMGGEGSVHFPQ